MTSPEVGEVWVCQKGVHKGMEVTVEFVGECCVHVIGPPRRWCYIFSNRRFAEAYRPLEEVKIEELIREKTGALYTPVPAGWVERPDRRPN